MLKKLLWLSLYFISFSLEASVSAHLSMKEASIGDRINLSVTVQGSPDDDIQLPSLDFVDILGESSSSSITFINGKMSRTKTLTYTLLVTKEGQHIIPPMTVIISGKESRTKPLSLSVVPASDKLYGKKRQRTRDSSVDDDDEEEALPEAFITRKISKTNMFVGEPVIAEVKFYYAIQVQNLEARPSKSDYFRYLNYEQESFEERYGGKLYHVLSIKRLFIPIKSGSFDLDGFYLNAELLYENSANHNQRRRSPFSDFFMGNRFSVKQKSFATDPDKITIKAIPSEKRPIEYHGLIGDFQVKVDLSDRSIKAGDTTTLTITIQGQGSLDSMKTPELRLPSSIKVYADKPESTEALHPENGLLSRKVFKYALVPTKEGSFDLGQYKESFFDFKKKNFRILSSSLGELEVTPGEAPSTRSDLPSSTLLKQEKVASISSDLIDIKRNLASSSLYKADKAACFVPKLITLFLVLIYGLLLLFPKLSFLSPKMTAKRRKALAYKIYKERKAKLSSNESHEEISLLLKSYFADKFDLNASSLTEKELKLSLEKTFLDEDLRKEVLSLFSHLQKASFGYAKVSEESVLKNLGLIHTVIKKVESHV